jgi:transposase
MSESFSQRFEAGLQQILDGLVKPRAENRPDKLRERIGRLKQKSRGTSQHYTVGLVTDESGKRVTGITWQKVPRERSQAMHPGVYCLRTNQLDWDEERLWRTYTLLTDLESVFRSLKSELGLRPVYHHQDDRADGHLFITVLAYQCVQFLRLKLKAAGIHDSWTTLRETLSVQRRVTTTFRQRDGRALHVRKATNAEPELMAIYRALGVNPEPGGTKKLTS